MSSNENSQSEEGKKVQGKSPALSPTVSIASAAPSPFLPPLLPSTTIAHQEELRQIWHSTLGAFLDDPANKHLTMKLSFGALIGESMSGNFRQPLQREARLEISLLQTQSDKEKEDEKDAEIVAKQKAERRQRRREKKQRQRASDRNSWRWSDLSTASTISTSALSSTSSVRVMKKTKDKSLSPPQSSMATTCELPTGEQYSVRYMGALGRMGALGLIEGSSIVNTDPTIREPGVTSSEDHTLKEVASIERISPSQSADATDRSRSPPCSPMNDLK
ncbi:unnamed protein product, partial [Mesorhabditis belari]|uniref:Uncharacterized protein n=1 Tax=Mesorhabditis belari TaxID=2138241 RepID=A0AAF3EFW4_9BILA